MAPQLPHRPRNHPITASQHRLPEYEPYLTQHLPSGWEGRTAPVDICARGALHVSVLSAHRHQVAEEVLRAIHDVVPVRETDSTQEKKSKSITLCRLSEVISVCLSFHGDSYGLTRLHFNHPCHLARNA